jgi:DNA replication protein DnaC
MRIPPTLDTLRALGLSGLAQALQEQLPGPDLSALSFEERLGRVVDRELTARESRRLKTRLRQAPLRPGAAGIEDIDQRAARGLDRALRATRAPGQGVRDHHKVLIVGPTGIGKSWMACAYPSSSQSWPQPRARGVIPSG